MYSSVFFTASIMRADVVLVARVVEDLDADAAPWVAPDRIPRRQEGEELRDRRVGLVVKVAAAALGPFALKAPGRQRDLVGVGADRGLEVQPVGVAGEPVELARAAGRRCLPFAHGGGSPCLRRSPDRRARGSPGSRATAADAVWKNVPFSTTVLSASLLTNPGFEISRWNPKSISWPGAMGDASW